MIGPMEPDPQDKASAGEDETDGEEVSLNSLSEAFASLMDKGETSGQQESTDFKEETGRGEKPEDSCAERSDLATGGQADPSLDMAVNPGGEVSPQSILEAMLFVGNENNQPLTVKQVVSFVRGVTPEEVESLIESLNESYESERTPYRIAAVGAGYRMVLSGEFDRLRDKFYGRVRQARLSQAAVEVLAIVAYKQPVTRADVDKLRGQSSTAMLSQLVRRQILRIERPDKNPQNAQYFTTDRFLQLFHLENLDDLPQSQDLDRVV